MKKLSKKHRRNIVILFSCLFVLLIGFQNCGKKEKGSGSFGSGDNDGTGGGTTTTTTPTTSQNATLEVTEIENSGTPQQRWTWNCNQPSCDFRYFITEDSSYSFPATQRYSPQNFATKNNVEGDYFLYIQAEKNESESAVKKVSIVIGPESNGGGGNPALIDQIDIGGSHTCALTHDNGDDDAGHVKCWGLNDKGQLGYGSTDNIGDGAGEVSGLVDVDVHPDSDDNHLTEFIATGGQHTCVLLENKCVKCWGSNELGQLGYSDTNNNIGDADSEMGSNLGPVGGQDFKVKSIATGLAHSCSITTDDKAKCWGANDKGQLGQGNTDNLTFNEAPQSNDIADIDIHDDPSEQDQAKIEGFLPRHIATGTKHTCAVLNNDCIKCWGENKYGQLGYEVQTNNPNLGDETGEMGTNLPPVGGMEFKVKAIAVGDSHTCAIMNSDDSVQCWGLNDKKQLGLGSTATSHHVPLDGTNLSTTKVDLGSNTAKSITAGAKHTCVTLNDDTTKCWGLNNSGQLGQGSTDDINDASGIAVPIENSGTIAGKTIASGENTCFIGDDGKVKCWGNNEKGQLAQDHACSLGNGLGYSASSNDKCNPSSTASDVMGKTVDTINYLSFE